MEPWRLVDSMRVRPPHRLQGDGGTTPKDAVLVSATPSVDAREEADRATRIRNAPDRINVLREEGQVLCNVLGSRRQMLPAACKPPKKGLEGGLAQVAWQAFAAFTIRPPGPGAAAAARCAPLRGKFFRAGGRVRYELLVWQRPQPGTRSGLRIPKSKKKRAGSKSHMARKEGLEQG